MNKKYRQKDLYNQEYPYDLPWHKAMWICQPGDLVYKDGRLQRVVAARLLPIEGALPEITLEDVEEV